jgi:hypothetical protein
MISKKLFKMVYQKALMSPNKVVQVSTLQNIANIAVKPFGMVQKPSLHLFAL